jgi:hypothetical protein
VTRFPVATGHPAGIIGPGPASGPYKFFPAMLKNAFARWFCFFAAIVAITACKNEGNKANFAQKEAILDILQKVQAKLNSPDNIYCSEARLAACDAKIAATTDPAERIALQFFKAQVLLEYGDEPSSVVLLESLESQIQGVGKEKAPLYKVMGLAYLRLAERRNCVNQHNTESCIMPIEGKGVHNDKDAARKAIASFETLLRLDPTDMDARWLLNILYMIVGEYPQSVPKPWLIPGLRDTDAATVKAFTDMAPDLGLNFRNRSGGIIVDDFDNDGFLDIVNSAWGLDDPMQFFHNNGDGTFTNASEKSGLSRYTGGLNLTQTDYNNDGFVDIFVLRGAWQGQAGFGEQPNSLIRNNGDGTFTDVTIEAGLLSYLPTQTATWNDFNRDGWLDVFIGNESYSETALNPCELYINNQNGTFTNVAGPNVLDISLFAKGVGSGDYDNDGWPDIVISSMSGHKILLRNKGVAGKVPLFENASEQAGFLRNNSKTFPCWFFDYDNDGWLDIFMCNYDFQGNLSQYAAKEALRPSADRSGKIEIFRNLGNGRFDNMSTKMNLNQVVFAMGANFGDIDNDGWIDMYLSTGNPNYFSLVPNKLYRNVGGKDFADVTVSSKTGNLQKGHAVAFADLNNNGDQDIFVDMGGAFRGDSYFASFYLNPGQSDNNWICLKLEGKQTNRAAIGARVAVKFRENGTLRTVYREVNSGGSFGCSPLRREIGVGKATVIEEIRVKWPVSGAEQVFEQVAPNQFLRIREGQSQLEKMDSRPIVFKKSDGSIPMCAPRR